MEFCIFLHWKKFFLVDLLDSEIKNEIFRIYIPFPCLSMYMSTLKLKLLDKHLTKYTILAEKNDIWLEGSCQSRFFAITNYITLISVVRPITII